MPPEIAGDGGNFETPPERGCNMLEHIRGRLTITVPVEIGPAAEEPPAPALTPAGGPLRGFTGPVRRASLPGA